MKLCHWLALAVSYTIEMTDLLLLLLAMSFMKMLYVMC